MNKPLSEQEIAKLEVPGPVEIKPMTRAEKLHRWADLVDQSPSRLPMYYGIEHMPPTQLETLPTANTMVETATKDPILADAGLKDVTTLGPAMRFFELSPAQLHVFACGCGGELTNRDMAARISHLADNPTFGC